MRGVRLYGVNQQALRQTLIAPELLSRATATWRFLVYGMQPFGALAGGFNPDRRRGGDGGGDGVRRTVES